MTGLPLYILAGIAAIAVGSVAFFAIRGYLAERADLRALRDFQDRYGR